MLLTKIRQQSDALTVADKIVMNLAEPISFGRHQLQVGCSIGISLFPTHADTPDELVSLADQAMYRAKEQGRGGFALYTASIHIDKKT